MNKSSIFFIILALVATVGTLAYIFHDSDIYCDYSDIKRVEAEYDDKGRPDGYYAVVNLDGTTKYIEINNLTYIHLVEGAFSDSKGIIFTKTGSGVYRVRRDNTHTDITHLNK